MYVGPINTLIFGQAFHSQGTLGAKSYITQNSNWKIISYKSNEKKIFIWYFEVLHSYTVIWFEKFQELHSYTITLFTG